MYVKSWEKKEKETRKGSRSGVRFINKVTRTAKPYSLYTELVYRPKIRTENVDISHNTSPYTTHSHPTPNIHRIASHRNRCWGVHYTKYMSFSACWRTSSITFSEDKLLRDAYAVKAAPFVYTLRVDIYLFYYIWCWTCLTCCICLPWGKEGGGVHNISSKCN